MTRAEISQAIGGISESHIEETMNFEGKRKKPLWMKIGAVAACVLAFAVSVPIVLNIMQDKTRSYYVDKNQVMLEDLNRPYKNVAVSPSEMAVAWRWEYLTVDEKYTSIEIDGTNFSRLGRKIDADLIGKIRGTYEAVGYNEPYDTPEGGYRESFDVYEIQGVYPQFVLAVKMEGDYYAFISEAARSELSHMRWGEVLERYGLADAIELGYYAKHAKGKETDYFYLRDDAYIWEVLNACKDAPSVGEKEWKKDGDYFSFRVTSDVFGVYKRALYVTEDGYLWTNIFDVACVYNIGKDASEKIIEYAKSNSDKAKLEPYNNSIVGTVTQITDEYILLDDSVMCKNPDNGITFKILLNDLRINRYVYDSRIKVGDTVSIIYEGRINISEGYVIDSGVSATPAILIDGDALIPE